MKKIPEYEALVLEGGSLRCAFTAGVLDGFASLGYRPFKYYYGVSAGSMAMISFLSGQRGHFIELSEKLIEDGADITAYDPEAMENIKAIIGDKIKYAKRSMEALEGAEALLICTEWAAFRNANFDKMKAAMASPIQHGATRSTSTPHARSNPF